MDDPLDVKYHEAFVALDNHDYVTFKSIINEHPNLYDYIGENLFTLMGLAIMNNDVEGVRALIDLGFNLNSRFILDKPDPPAEPIKQTPLEYAQEIAADPQIIAMLTPPPPASGGRRTRSKKSKKHKTRKQKHKSKNITRY